MNSTGVSALSLLPSLIAFSFSSIPPHLYSNTLLKIIKFQTLSTLKNNFKNQECSSDLTSLISGAFNSELWALEMLDASGKINPGLLHGNIHLQGNYDQCLDINEEVEDRTIAGQYCTLIVTIKDEVAKSLNLSSTIENLMNLVGLIQEYKHFHMTKNVSVLWGVCVPKSCSVRNLEDLARHVEAKYQLPVKTIVVEELCSYKGKSVNITETDVRIYSFFLAILLIIFLSTIYDTHLRCSGQESNCFVIFSAYTNLEKLFSGSSQAVNLSCLNGIKFWSCCWIILGHVAISTTNVVKNPLDVVTKWKYYKSGIFVLSAFYSVANFFTISGFLVSYLYLKYSEKGSINLLSFYLGRFLRLTPALLAMSFVHISILKLLADGPYGVFTVTLFKENYSGDNWWETVLSFLNLSKHEEVIPHTWYLSVDSQLYLWAPLILFFIKKYPRSVLTGTTVASLIGILYSSLVTITKRLGVVRFDWNKDYKDYLYLSSFFHLPSWLIGIVLGYTIYQNKIRISKTLNLSLWIVSIYVMLRLIFDQSVFLTEEYNVYRAALWNGFSKPLWSLALGFIIFSCATENGGFMNTFLSHPVFRVLGRLTYSMSLIHMSILTVILGNKTETRYFGYFQVLTEFGLTLLVTLVCSLFLYLGFEAPIMALKYQVEKNNNRKQDTKKDS